MKNIIILFIVFTSLLSCNAKDKVNETAKKQDVEIKKDKNTLIWSQIEPLPNYSYKGYQIEPLLSENYKMPIEIGSEWLVLYHRVEDKLPIRDLKLYKIQDSIEFVLSKSKYIILEFDQYGMDTIAIPVIDETLTNPETMFFFKGFGTYNTHLANDYINDKFSNYREYMEGEREDSLQIIHYDFKYDGKSFSFQETYIESDADVKVQREEFVREAAHYIVFKNAKQSQCLIYRQSDGEILNPIEYWDLDGDGLPDPMFNINYNITEEDGESIIHSRYSSYLLFLSSEAEEGELLKHVATKTILYSRDVYPITKE